MSETCPVCGGQACGESRTEPPAFRVGGLYLTRNRKHAVLVENGAGRSLVGAFVEHGYLLPPARVTACDGTVVLHSINNRYTWSKGGRFGEDETELDLVEELGPVLATQDGKLVVTYGGPSRDQRIQDLETRLEALEALWEERWSRRWEP